MELFLKLYMKDLTETHLEENPNITFTELRSKFIEANPDLDNIDVFNDYLPVAYNLIRFKLGILKMNKS